MPGGVILSKLATEIVIPASAIIRIVFSLLQWFFVSCVKFTFERSCLSTSNKNGYGDSFIEEEKGIDDNSVVNCADIQSAMFEGEIFIILFLFWFSRFGSFLFVFEIWVLKIFFFCFNLRFF